MPTNTEQLSTLTIALRIVGIAASNSAAAVVAIVVGIVVCIVFFKFKTSQTVSRCRSHIKTLKWPATVGVGAARRCGVWLPQRTILAKRVGG